MIISTNFIILHFPFCSFQNFSSKFWTFSNFVDFFIICEPGSIYPNETPIVAPVIKMLQLTVVQSKSALTNCLASVLSP